MRIAVLQPSYLPWLGYLDQIASVDAFVFYDDVQYDRNGWRNRNRIRTQNEQGWTWLTIPVQISGFPPINEVNIDQRAPWQRKHAASIHAAYARAPHLALFDQFFADIYGRQWERLADVAIASVHAMMQALAVDTPTYRSSELGISGDRNGRLLALCKHFGATEYLSGDAAKVYLDEAAFAAEGISVRWQSYDHPVYPQTAKPFVSHLSALDALLNVGNDARKFLHTAALGRS